MDARTGRRTPGLAACLLIGLVAGCGSVRSSPSSPKPSETAAAPVASTSPAASPSPSPAMMVTAGPGEPWKTVAWSSDRVAVPWTALSGLLVPWRNGWLGLGTAPNESGQSEAVLAESRDLSSWTVLARGRALPFGDALLVAGPDRLLAIGSPYDGRMWTSTDGLSWKEIRPRGLDSPLFTNPLPASGPAGIVGTDGTPARILYSGDGSDWQAARLPGGSQARAFTATWIGNRFVAFGQIGNEPAAWWSADGLNWSQGQLESIPSTPGFDNCRSLSNGVELDGRLLAFGWIGCNDAGGPGGLWLSLDARSWTVVEPQFELRSAPDFAGADPGLSLVATNGRRVLATDWRRLYETLDGIHWREVASNADLAVSGLADLFITSTCRSFQLVDDSLACLHDGTDTDSWVLLRGVGLP